MSSLTVAIVRNKPSPPREPLLAWYRPRRRAYPWRSARPDPYAVLVSEVMLQQTQAARVVPAFRLFLERFPSVHALSSAPTSEVLRAWDGLGYNRRAVALSEAARAIVRDHRGRVPADPHELGRLPGVGPYTAAAVSSIAYGTPVAAIDTNVRRIVARVAFGTESDGVSMPSLRGIAERWLDVDAPGDWNQALMDLGRDVCRPHPRCEACPLASGCAFLRSGASPRRGARRQPPFEGSFRQVRGRVVGILRERSGASLAVLASESGEPLERIAAAVAALARDGVVRAGPAAFAGRPTGRARLAT